MLLAAAGVALLWANSPWADSYQALWHAGVTLPAIGLRPDLHFLINDGLMTLFFFVVGLEIRRELHDGTLADRRQAALPLRGLDRIWVESSCFGTSSGEVKSGMIARR